MPWLIGEYAPVALFSLRHGEATSTGGKSLLIPTPFALRTGLLDVALRIHGRDVGPTAFDRLKALRIALRPPQYAVQIGLFGKILKPERDKQRGRPMQSTIAFREYVQWQGNLGLALGGSQADLDFVAPLLPHLTYLGKRGSFIQLVASPRQIEGEEPPAGFILLEGIPLEENRPAVPLPGDAFTLGTIQRVDDWGPGMTYERANVYSAEPIRLGRHRVRFDVVVPYQVVRAGRGFIVYRRV